MVPRDTRTGSVLEQMVLPALNQGGYEYQTQVNIGQRPGGRRHIVDVVAIRNKVKILISLKWQQISGTAEQKVSFEVICLTHALQQGAYNKAYLVLGGTGWTLRDYYISGGLDAYLKVPSDIKIISLEDFIALANQGKL
ncbi:MAG: hypothetical protein GX044_10175 [Firmicutes bacterium]|jgi:hypothetical protein|nr:hypothetical protein [Bacillota bacterium]